jgi:cell wall-associated NlpC family hydrolase
LYNSSIEAAALSEDINKQLRNTSKIIYKVLRTTLLVLLTAMLVLSTQGETLAAKKKNKKKRRHRVSRVYHPEKTKAQAMAMIQTSDNLAELANIEFRDTTSESDAYKNNKSSQTPVAITPAPADTSVIAVLKALYSENENEEIVGELGEDAAELEAEDDEKVDVSDFKSIWIMAMGGDDTETTSYGVSKSEIMNIIMDWLGTPYRFGGVTEKAIDCSAWVRTVFYQADSIVLPRTAREQFTVGRAIKRDKLEFGDLVFFHTYSRRYASHVGIYLGDDLFAHASSVAGVTVSSLNSTYYNNRFIGGKRFRETDLASHKDGSSLAW